MTVKFKSYAELLESAAPKSIASIPVCYNCVRIVALERAKVDCPDCGHAIFWDRIAYKKLRGRPVFKSNLAHYASDESLAVRLLQDIDNETLERLLNGKKRKPRPA